MSHNTRTLYHRAANRPAEKRWGPIANARGQLGSKTVHFRVEYRQASRVRPVESSLFMERAMGIEPKSERWESLPIVRTCVAIPSGRRRPLETKGRTFGPILAPAPPIVPRLTKSGAE
jgi:hypothetical protein